MRFRSRSAACPCTSPASRSPSRRPPLAPRSPSPPPPPALSPTWSAKEPPGSDCPQLLCALAIKMAGGLRGLGAALPIYMWGVACGYNWGGAGCVCVTATDRGFVSVSTLSRLSSPSAKARHPATPVQLRTPSSAAPEPCLELEARRGVGRLQRAVLFKLRRRAKDQLRHMDENRRGEAPHDEILTGGLLREVMHAHGPCGLGAAARHGCWREVLVPVLVPAGHSVVGKSNQWKKQPVSMATVCAQACRARTGAPLR